MYFRCALNFYSVASAAATVVAAAVVAAAATGVVASASVAAIEEKNSGNDDEPSGRIFKKIAKAVHIKVLLFFGIRDFNRPKGTSEFCISFPIPYYEEVSKVLRFFRSARGDRT